MLEGQNSCRDQNSNLLSVVYRLECRTNSDFCFSEAYIAADQTVHWAFVLHVGFYLLGCLELIWRVFIYKRRFQFGLKITVRIVFESFF
ncbi:hypothetical protein D9M69_512440 [compost metagenome]